MLVQRAKLLLLAAEGIANTEAADRPTSPDHAALRPTSASWLNLVEVFFAIIDRQALRRGDFTSVEQLISAIGRFCAGWNQGCEPFTWTKPADEILARLSLQTTPATRR